MKKRLGKIIYIKKFHADVFKIAKIGYCHFYPKALIVVKDVSIS